MAHPRNTPEQISNEAIDWFLQFQPPARGQPDEHAFSEWLLRSPEHVEEYLRVSCAWRALGAVNEGCLHTEALVAAARHDHETHNVVDLQARLVRQSGPPGGAPRTALLKRSWWAVPAALILAAGLWIGYLSWQLAATFETAIGEQRSITLQDGSVVFLNTNSKVRVRWLPAERRIDLVQGEARFKVAKDAARAFIVTTAKAAVRAVGTVFNVRTDAQRTEVAVLEGQVDVMQIARGYETESPAPPRGGGAVAAQPAAPTIRLAAGERAAVTTLGIQTNVGPSLEAVAAWTERRLVFRDQALSAVVSEFNRYRTRPLVLEDPDLGHLKISGVFDLSDPESLIAYLGAYEAVRIDRRPDGSEHLFRTPARPQQPK
jgi:transmembrane sensor